MEAIVACPHCKDKPSLTQHIKDDPQWQMRCDNCGYILYRTTAEDAISEWNRYIKVLSKIIIKKEYSGESIPDIEEDIYCAILESDISIVEEGTFELLLTWKRKKGNE